MHNEDCRNTMQRDGFAYDYALWGPPDYSELGIEPLDSQWDDLLGDVIDALLPVPTTVALTDRKHNGTIICKGSRIAEMFAARGWEMIGQKIWVKSFKRNLYRLNFSHVYSFRRKGAKVKQHHADAYERDCWNLPEGKYRGFAFGFPVGLAIRCLANFTTPGDVVYDPFAGSGTTGAAASEALCDFIGSEINPRAFNLACERLGC